MRKATSLLERVASGKDSGWSEVYGLNAVEDDVLELWLLCENKIEKPNILVVLVNF